MRDDRTRTELDAAKADRATAWDDKERDRDIDEGPVAEFTHQHGEGLICLYCAWLRARNEHLGLVPDAELAWCERCADEYTATTGCAHGLGLCPTCLHYCPDCRADIEDAAADQMRERMRDWGGGDGA